ncbi:MAG: class II aldolase/adducin family protein [Clostridiales bacterium]|nr:class II aldolase/adducin family protein [Clostridiales bacterium]
MYENEKKSVLDAALEIKRNHLVALCGGNISLRLPDNTFLVTPSGMIYEDMIPDDVVRIDETGTVIEGIRRPSSDAPALLYIFKKMPWVNAVIHTHQPWATAVGLVADVLPACLVTQIDANRSDVYVAPFTPSGEKQMGVLTVEYAHDAWAVILKHHGVMAYGPTLKDAIFSAVYLEESAQTYMIARSVGSVPTLDPALVQVEADSWHSYGQPSARNKENS